MATPQRSGFGNATPSVLGTPLSVTGSSYSSTQTPLRDQFGLNDVSDTLSVSESLSVSSRADRERERAAKARIALQLKALPEPEYTYEISIPDIEDDIDMAETKPEDAADIALRQEALRREEKEAEMRRRSTVLRRSLPRPASIISDQLAKSVYPPSHTLHEASAMINREMIRIVQHDNYMFPSEAATKKGLRPIPVELDSLEDNYLQIAREMVQHEFNALVAEKGDIDLPAFVAAWDELHKVLFFFFF